MELDPETAGLDSLNVANGSDDEETRDWSKVLRKPSRIRAVKAEAPDQLSPNSGCALDSSRAAMMEALRSRRATPELTVIIDQSNGLDITLAKPRGKFLETMGRVDSNAVCHLTPEEALYLIERGTLSATLANDPTNLSLGAVYSLLASQPGQLDRYLVYATLKRAGYVVLRPQPSASDNIATPNMTAIARSPMKLWPAILATITSWLRVPFPYTLAGSYSNVYSFLSHLFRMAPPSPSQQLLPPVTEDFFVWKPSGHFSKKSPPPPDYRLAVVSANSKLPTPAQLPAALGSKITFAVVDDGIVSFSSLTTVSFSDDGIVWKGR